jgi:hypothetical protein
MRQRERLVLAAFCWLLGLPLCRADGATEADGAAMARAPLPPPLRATPSGADRLQPQPSLTGSPRHDPTAPGSFVLKPGDFVTHSAKHAHGAITAVHPYSAFSRRYRAPAARYRKHRHLDGTNFAAARGAKQLNRLPSSEPSRDPEYDSSAESPAALAPVALPPPPFAYAPQVPLGYPYPPEYQPPWLPGPTPPR